MNIFKLTFSYIRQKKLGTFLNVALFGLGMATMVVLLLFSKQLDDNVQSNIEGIDLVVGAKGSPLQLILSSVFHIDAPTGNIPVEEALALSAHPMIAETIPLALGDSYNQYRIVGTTPALLEHYEVALAEGSPWRGLYEVVVGADVARETGLVVGDTVISAHGIGGGNAHGDHPLKVVGILEPAGTVIDRLITTEIETVWAVHGAHADEEGHDHDEDARGEEGHDHDEEAHGEVAHDDQHERPAPNAAASDKGLEYTSLLVKYKTPIAAATMPRYINNETSMQAAAPVLQTARLLSLLGSGIDAFRIFAYVLIVAAALGVFIALYNAMKERAYDLAIMRTMGASRRFLLSQVLLEGVSLSLLGALFGLLLGHGATEILGKFLGQSQGLNFSGFSVSSDELWLLVLTVAIGMMASLIPAIQAYRTDIARTLSRS